MGQHSGSRSVYTADGAREDVRGISRRVAAITVSAIKQMPVLAAEVGGCVSLGQGIPSVPTPAFIRDAVIKALCEDEEINRYSLQPGVPALRAEIARYLGRLYGVDCDPQREVFVSCGGMEALAAGIATIVDEGDEVILPSPTYSSHIEQIIFAGGTPVFVPLQEERGWALDAAAVSAAVSARTKAIVLCNPSNPTGGIFDEPALRSIAELAEKHDLWIVSDQAYDFLRYGGGQYFSLLQVPEVRARLLTVGSFSKLYCMTGWRVGYMHAPARLIQQVLKVHDAFAICAPTISQYAALAALRETNGRDGAGDAAISGLVRALSERRELVCRRLTSLSRLFSFQPPAGAYYVFPKLRSADLPSVDFCLRLLREARVIAIPGAAFGPTGEGHVRFSFGGSPEELEEAFDRIERWAG